MKNIDIISIHFNRKKAICVVKCTNPKCKKFHIVEYKNFPLKTFSEQKAINNVIILDTLKNKNQAIKNFRKIVKDWK